MQSIANWGLKNWMSLWYFKTKFYVFPAAHYIKFHIDKIILKDSSDNGSDD